MAQHDPVKVAFVICFAAGISSAAVQFTIQREVNEMLPEEERFSSFHSRADWGWRRRMFRAHRRFYPDSELRTLYWIYSGISMLSIGFIFLQTVRTSR